MQLAPSPAQLHTPVTPSPIVNPKLKSTTKTTKQSSNSPRSRTSSQAVQHQKKTQLQQPKKVKVSTKTANKEASLRKTSTLSVSSNDLSSNLNCMSPSEVSVNVLGKFIDLPVRCYIQSVPLFGISTVMSLDLLQRFD